MADGSASVKRLAEGRPAQPSFLPEQDHLQPTSTRRPPPPLYKAVVKNLAHQGAMNKGDGDGPQEAIILRIKKCFDRARHLTTPEAEAKAALHMGSRLMSQYNVSQAEILASESVESQQQYAGQSTVILQRNDGNSLKRVRHQAFVDDLSTAMCNFFDCKMYSTATLSSLEITFYGIADNTIAAAMAFEMAYNLVVEWARTKLGAGRKNSYCQGAAFELKKRAREEKASEEAMAKEADNEGRDRFEESPSSFSDFVPESLDKGFSHGTMSTDVQEDTDDDDLDGLFDVNLAAANVTQLFRDGERTMTESAVNARTSHDAGSEHPLPAVLQADANVKISSDAVRSQHAEFSASSQSLWHSHTQLALFRNTASNIADEYLKSQNVRLYSSSVRHGSIRNWDAYDEGRRDGSKIDIKRKRIEGL